MRMVSLTMARIRPRSSVAGNPHCGTWLPHFVTDAWQQGCRDGGTRGWVFDLSCREPYKIARNSLSSTSNTADG